MSESQNQQTRTHGEFHWRDGWYFSRAEDGSVQVRIGDGPTKVIPPAEWASIVAWVTGDYPGAYAAALALHTPSIERPEHV